MKTRTQIALILTSLILAAIVGSLTTFILLKSQKPTKNDLIREFYEVENAVHVSPHSLRKMMDKKDASYVLVDLRSPQEYEKEHIVTAINIPAYKDPNTSAYDEKERIISEFDKLVKLDKSRDIIVYCYSMPCMTGRKIGLMLSEKGIYVKHLGIGWNEWRYFWNLWNHDGETPSKMEDYIASGKDPGSPKGKGLPSPCTQGDLGC
jgi:rhodanese-related sulfurtransferase